MNAGLDPIDLILTATPVVQGVMALLLLASVLSWVAIFQRSFDLRTLRSDDLAFEDAFWSGRDFRELFREIREGSEPRGLEALFEAGFLEFSRHEGESLDPELRVESIGRAMRVALAREEARMERYLPFLATVGNVSPYVGLFGTVWGIMNAFLGLAGVAQVTLQTVAPGIAEALIATAMGLFAAIPAVVAYNRLATAVDERLKAHQTFIDELTAVLQRTLYQRVRQGGAEVPAGQATAGTPRPPSGAAPAADGVRSGTGGAGQGTEPRSGDPGKGGGAGARAARRGGRRGEPDRS